MAKIINIKNLLEKYLLIFLVLIGTIIVFSIPLWFIMSGQVLEPIFAKIINIRLDHSISGGPIISKFYDETFDDYADGSYQYPLHKSFIEENICDLTTYEVYRPILDNGLNNPLGLWQVAVGLSKFINPLKNEGGFSNIQISIYIDIDGNENGSTKTYFEDAEYIGFESVYGWDLMIIINGLKKDKATLYYSNDIVDKANIYGLKNYDKDKGKEIRAIYVDKHNKIYVQIPLDNKFIQRILDGRKTYHWVFSGFHDIYGNGGWLNVKEYPTIRYGGGLKWDYGPRIFDLITPSGYEQKDLLSIKNINSESLVVIPPLISEGFDTKIRYLKEKEKDAKNNQERQLKIEVLKKQIEEEEKFEKEIFEKQINEKLNSDNPIDRLYALFSNSRFDESQNLVEHLLQQDKDNPVALAYKGSLTAMEGGKTKNPMEAIILVNKAYEYLDKACYMMENFENNITNGNFEILKHFKSEEEFYQYYIIVLSNRAIVSSSVPDDIFNKLDIAISDFQKIAKLYEKIGKIKESTFAKMQAAILLEKKGKKDLANIIWLSLLKLKDLPAKVELELLKRNFK
ncbi:MAG TPA: glucodextranase DOMON-like domain-containing protein [Exilispira sp.]|nr:glucodextranase DOMON-like domain-containing protein [Exilispira sp.]